MSCWKAPNNSRGSVTPIYSNLLFRRNRQARLSSVGIPPPSDPHSASSFRKGSSSRARSLPSPGPSPACVLPCAPCSPLHAGRPGAPSQGSALWLPAGLVAAPAAGRPQATRSPACPPTCMKRSEALAVAAPALAAGGCLTSEAGGGRNPSPTATTYICITRSSRALFSDQGWRCESGSPPRRRLAGGQRGGPGTRRSDGGAG